MLTHSTTTIADANEENVSNTQRNLFVANRNTRENVKIWRCGNEALRQCENVGTWEGCSSGAYGNVGRVFKRSIRERGKSVQAEHKLNYCKLRRLQCQSHCANEFCIASK
jgi:hypothetical protein